MRARLRSVPSPREVFWRTTLRDRNLSSVSQAGLVNNLNDGMAWGLFPLVFAASGLRLDAIGVLAALYPATWSVGQIVTGGLSDRIGRKPLIVWGMWLQAIGVALVAASTAVWGFASAAVLLGIGTAMVYPALLAAVGDVAHPSWRASAVGVYRLWRDLGYAIGAVIAGSHRRCLRRDGGGMARGAVDVRVGAGGRAADGRDRAVDSPRSAGQRQHEQADRHGYAPDVARRATSRHGPRHS